VPNTERADGRRFDRDHGVTTAALLFLGELDGKRRSEAYAHATHYEAVPVADFRALMNEVPRDFVRTSTFVDVGAGMGRAVLLATEYPFKQIVGIELSRALSEIARENVAKAHGLRTQCRDVRLAPGDARKGRYPKGNLVVFLYNPFDAEALAATFERIASTRAPADETIAIYHTPVHADVFDALGAQAIATLPCGIVARVPANAV
jgi:SAM-dependent methyltransferase